MARKKPRAFDVEAFLDSSGVSRKVLEFRPRDVVFAQGDPSDSVMYIQQGSVKISVLSEAGKEAVIAMLGPGEFFGEGALAAQPVRMATATAMGASRILVIEKQQMIRLLHKQHDLSDRFITYILARNIRVEEDLVDHLHNMGMQESACLLGSRP